MTGFTLTDEQSIAASAVAVGVLGAIALLVAWRKARTGLLVLVVVLALVILAAWIRFGR